MFEPKLPMPIRHELKTKMCITEPYIVAFQSVRTVQCSAIETQCRRLHKAGRVDNITESKQEKVQMLMQVLPTDKVQCKKPVSLTLLVLQYYIALKRL